MSLFCTFCTLNMGHGAGREDKRCSRDLLLELPRDAIGSAKKNDLIDNIIFICTSL